MSINVSSVKPDPTVFKPSLPLTISSTLTSPENLIAGALAGGAALFGASLPLTMAIGGGAILLQKLFKKIVSGGEALRPAAFLSAESTSSEIRGGVHSLIIPPVLECVKKMDTPNSKKLEKGLENILFYVQHFDYTGLTNHRLVELCKEKIRNLNPGEMIALPCSHFSPSNSGHLMIAVFERKADSFSVTIHNSNGINHYEKCDLGKSLYQTGLQIDEVQLPNLFPFIEGLSRLHSVRSKNSRDKLYRELVPALKGKFAAPSDDSRIWNKDQQGMSCSGESVKCLIRSLLTKEEYNEFKMRFFSSMVIKLEQGLESGHFWEQTADHHLILKMLKLKLMGMPKEHMEKEVLDILKKPDSIEPSSLAKLSKHVEKRFWDFVFGETLIEQDKYMLKVFDLLNPKINCLKLNLEFFPIEDDVEELCIQTTALFKKLEKDPAFSVKERQELFAAFKDFERFKSKTKVLENENNLLLEKINRLNEAMIPYFKGHPTQPFIADLFKAMDLIKQKKDPTELLMAAFKKVQDNLGTLGTQAYGNARLVLEDFYGLYHTHYPVTSEQLRSFSDDATELSMPAYEKVQNSLRSLDTRTCAEVRLVLEDFYELYHTHYPETPEELRSFAVIELILGSLIDKLNQTSPDYLPDVFIKSSLNRLFQWHLDDTIKGSVWEEAMRADYQLEKDKVKAVARSPVQIPKYLK